MIDVDSLPEDVIVLLTQAWWEGYDAGVAQCGAEEGHDTKGGMLREENPYSGVAEARKLERMAALDEFLQLDGVSQEPEVDEEVEVDQYEHAVAYS